MTPKQKENVSLMTFGLVLVTLTFTMKWWFAPITKFVASTFYGM